MAEVFLAQQRGLEGFDRRVAVKRILPQLADAPDFIKMFLGEARLAAQLSHPNIVHIYDFGKVEDDYFIAMEYVDGVHAGQLMRCGEGDRLPPAMVARIGADAAAALHYAHELRAASGRMLGLVHRDVSPANLMVSFDGVVKLCDFGIAKAAALGDQLTNPGQVKGKFAYMSPEQTTGTPLDGRSDVFSLSIVLWELLAGRTIVARGDAVEAMRAIRDGRLTPIDVAVPGTPGALAAAITWGLQTRREHRPSAMELSEQLEAFIKSSPELATPIQLGAWLRARFMREPTEEIGSLAREGDGARATEAHGAADLGSLGGGERRWSAHPSVITSDTTSELMRLSREQVVPATIAPVGPATIAPISPAAVAAAGIAVHHGAPAADVAGQRAAHAPTVIPLTLPPQAPTLFAPQAGSPAGSVEAGDGGISVGGSGSAARAQLAVAPAMAPTLLDPDALPVPVSSTRGSPVVGVPALAAVALPAASEAGGARRRRVRLGLAVGGFFAMAALSFAIALAIRGGPTPSEVGAQPAGSSDAAQVAAEVLDTAPSAPAPSDAAGVAAAAPAVAPPVSARTILEVRTRPEGATVKVAGQRQIAPAQFTLPAGHYAIDAEFDGWMPERRSVDLVAGVRLVQDILFTTRLHGGRRVQTGRLTVRTTPPCEVFLGKRRLTETPFTDMEFEPATYALTFKHPGHPAVTKRVTITAGKTTRLSFTLR